MTPTDRELWLLAISTFGVGDVVTTTYGLGVDGVHESHPLSELVLAAGGPEAMVGVKVGLFILAFAAYNAAPDEYRTGIPIGLSLLGFAVTLNNLAVIEEASA